MMTAVTLTRIEPVEAPVRAAAGWRIPRDPLTGWRDDDPAALPRCSINPEHLIRNGDRYAIGGIKMACLPCAGLAPPPAPPDATPTPKPRAAILSRADRQFSGLNTPPKIEPPVRVTRARVAPTPPTPAPRRVETRTCAREGCEETFTVRPAYQRQRYCGTACVGLIHRKSKHEPVARPRRQAFRETRTCERCPKTFTVTSASRHQRFCSNTCAISATHERRRQASAAQPVRIVAVEPGTCGQCGAGFQPTPTRPLHCSWTCSMRAAADWTDHGERCPCLSCADARLDAGRPPLIGVRPQPVPSPSIGES